MHHLYFLLVLLLLMLLLVVLMGCVGVGYPQEEAGYIGGKAAETAADGAVVDSWDTSAAGVGMTHTVAAVVAFESGSGIVAGCAVVQQYGHR